MDRIKKLSCAIAALTLLLMQSNPALAKFGGTLRGDAPWTLSISGAGNAAVSITFVNSKGGKDTDLFTAHAGEDLVLYGQTNIPRGTRRIIIEVDSDTGNLFGSMTTIQGTSVIVVDSCNGADCEGAFRRIVFDVVSGSAT